MFSYVPNVKINDADRITIKTGILPSVPISGTSNEAKVASGGTPIIAEIKTARPVTNAAPVLLAPQTTIITPAETESFVVDFKTVNSNFAKDATCFLILKAIGITGKHLPQNLSNRSSIPTSKLDKTTLLIGTAKNFQDSYLGRIFCAIDADNKNLIFSRWLKDEELNLAINEDILRRTPRAEDATAALSDTPKIATTKLNEKLGMLDETMAQYFREEQGYSNSNLFKKTIKQQKVFLLLAKCYMLIYAASILKVHAVTPIVENIHKQLDAKATKEPALLVTEYQEIVLNLFRSLNKFLTPNSMAMNVRGALHTAAECMGKNALAKHGVAKPSRTGSMLQLNRVATNVSGSPSAPPSAPAIANTR